MRIKQMREAAGLSQPEMAKRLGISNEKYVKIESGTVEPTASQLMKAADIFGVSADYLLERDTPMSPGEKIWLNVRTSLTEEKLRTVAQMLNGVDNLRLSEDDIDNICDVVGEKSVLCGNDAQMKRLFNVDEGGDELTFDDYLILKKIDERENIYFLSEDADTLKTNYSFTYEGKFYDSKKVTGILLRLDRKFKLLSFYFILKKTKKGYECGQENYFKLNKKGKAVLKAKEDELTKLQNRLYGRPFPYKR